MYRTLRPLIFRLDPERAHTLTLYALRLAGAFPPLAFGLRKFFAVPPRPVTAFGLTFRNPVGLAAGYDKDALGWRGLATLGFGHIEVGTVTPQPQHGNPKPRLFRLPSDNGLINRLGFPGRGANFVAHRLKKYRQQSSTTQLPTPPSPISPFPILGVNIGKNKDTPNEKAARDYLYLMERFAPLADYLTVNVSSPNTVGLRRLQARAALEGLLGKLAEARRLSPVPRPILVKLAPDLTDEELDDSLEAILGTGMDGIIAANTSVRRDGLRSANAGETGGLSGAPLTRMSTEMVAKIHHRTGGEIPIIGVGGVMTPDDAKAKLDAGATLVQVLTGLIYAGPGLVKRVVETLSYIPTTIPPRQKPPPPRAASVPPPHNGDQLSRTEFERRYAAHPEIKKAELLEGEVYVASPIRFTQHVQPHGLMITWVGNYVAETPGTKFGPEPTVRLDFENEVQPDVVLFVAPEAGGRIQHSEDDYLEGPPELVVEVAVSSVAYDMYAKKRVYAHNEVRAYITLQVYEQKVSWFVLREGVYETLEPDENGIIRSEVFPGLWLKSDAIWTGDLREILATLRAGLASPEHETFVQQIKTK